MQTDSSASATYFASRSASECTTTVFTPSSRHARWIRNAISPRLAIRTLSKSLSLRRAGIQGLFTRVPRRRTGSSKQEQRLAELDRLAILDEDRLDRAAGVGLDLVHELHRLDDAKRVALRDGVADFDERRRAGRRRAIEGADHRALHDMRIFRH